MQITLNDQEIKQAILAKLKSQGLNFEGQAINLNFTTGRGGNGNSVTIEIGDTVTTSVTGNGITEGANIKTENFDIPQAKNSTEDPSKKHRRRRKRKDGTYAENPSNSDFTDQEAEPVTSGAPVRETDALFVEDTTAIDALTDELLDNPGQDTSDNDQENLFA